MNADIIKPKRIWLILFLILSNVLFAGTKTVQLSTTKIGYVTSTDWEWLISDMQVGYVDNVWPIVNVESRAFAWFDIPSDIQSSQIISASLTFQVKDISKWNDLLVSVDLYSLGSLKWTDFHNSKFGYGTPDGHWEMLGNGVNFESGIQKNANKEFYVYVSHLQGKNQIGFSFIANPEIPNGSVGNQTSQIILNNPLLNITYITLPTATSNPNPSNGSTNIPLSIKPSWKNNDNTVTYYKIYFGTNSILGDNDYLGSATATSFGPPLLKNGTTYYWRVDAVNPAGTTNGNTWHFTTEQGIVSPSKPTNPNPSNDAIDQPISLTLSWVNGGSASSYNVYFGTDKNNLSLKKENLSTTSITTAQIYGTLGYGIPYYWRIDAKNSAGTTIGDVWHFTTINASQNYRTLTVSSLNPNNGVDIIVIPNDNYGQGNGTTEFKRYFNNNTTVALQAPPNKNGNTFQMWQINGSDVFTNPNIVFNMDTDYNVTAIYQNLQTTKTLTVNSSNPNSGINITVSPNDNDNKGNGITEFQRHYNSGTKVYLGAPSALTLIFQKWQKNGLDFSTDQNIQFIMDSDYKFTAVYKNDNNNHSGWNSISMDDSGINSLSVCGNCLFASGYSIYVSKDDGSNWETSYYANFTTDRLETIGTNIYAVGSGIICSTNSGVTWNDLDNGLPTYQDADITSIIKVGSNLFAGTLGGGVFISTNNGSSWNPVNNGLTNSNIMALAVLGTNLFAGTWGNGVYCTSNNGNNWYSTNNGLNQQYIYSLTNLNTSLFAGTNGVFLSTNNGTSWNSKNYISSVENISSYVIRDFGVYENNLFVGTSNGIFRSTDYGNHWTPLNDGLPFTSIWSIAINDNYLFAATSNGIYKRALGEVITDIKYKQMSSMSTEVYLSQNFPNPFNPTTTISYSVPKTSFVTIKLFDVLGHEIETLLKGEKQPGNYSIEFNAEKISSGVYFYSMQVYAPGRASSFHTVKKLVVLK